MTPCEKLGYKVGDRFKAGHDGASGFSAGTDIILTQDDGTNRPLFEHAERSSFEQFCWLSEVEPLAITLSPGDYVSTDGITDAEYHAVAAAFMAAGCAGWPKKLNDEAEIIGWSNLFNCYGWDRGVVESFKRHLTPAQIIGAVNAKTPSSEEINMQNNDGWIENTGTCPVDRGTRIDVRYRDGSENLGVKAMVHPSDGSNPDRLAETWRLYSGDTSITHYRLISEPKQDKPDMHPIDNLHIKRQARDVAEQQYQAALAEVREAYPWIRVEEKSESLPLAQWKAGDILQCSKEEWFSCEKFTVGCDYEMRTNSRNVGGRMFADFIDDEDESMGAPLDHFRFVRRP